MLGFTAFHPTYGIQQLDDVLGRDSVFRGIVRPSFMDGVIDMALTVRVIAPDKTVWDAEAEEVILPSTTGQLGILAGHAPILSALDTGVLRVREGKDWTAIALNGGFAEVEQDEVTILVNGAERGDAIDLSAAEKEFSEAQSKMEAAEAGDDKSDKLSATQALKRARARVQAAGGKA